jgi:site-specific DNA-methyltransferase (adenine-specific)
MCDKSEVCDTLEPVDSPKAAPNLAEDSTRYRILLRDSTQAQSAAPDLVGCVSLVITSPPYHNAIDYKQHAVDSSKNYRKRVDLNYANDYLSLMTRVWDESWEMLKPGGHLVVNAGTVLDGGIHYPLPQDLIEQAMRSRTWQFIRTVVWFKVTAGVKRAGSVIQHPYPDYWSYNIMTEHIQVLRKPGPTQLNRSETPAEWWESVWDLAPVPPRQVDHPAPYPEDLAHRFIRMLTQPEDWVMDPFNGAGATTKAAVDLGRRGLGFDISEKYVHIGEDRISQNSSVRRMQLLIDPVPAPRFVPGKSRGRTRHGAGLGTRKRGNNG